MKYSPELLMALVIEGLEVLRSTGKQITEFSFTENL